MYQDRSFQEQNRKYQNQEITFENPVGKFRSQKSLADLKISSKRTKFDYFFCPLIDLLRHPAIFNWVVQVSQSEGCFRAEIPTNQEAQLRPFLNQKP